MNGRGPAGHLGCLFAGDSHLETLTTRFLAEGHSRGERLMFIAEAPKLEQWPSGLVDSGSLTVLSISKIYGRERRVVPEQQRDVFTKLVGEALADGYTGLRVVADNTSFVTDPQGIPAWKQWEAIVDQLTAANPLVGLCCFDHKRLPAGTLDLIQRLHPDSLEG